MWPSPPQLMATGPTSTSVQKACTAGLPKNSVASPQADTNRRSAFFILVLPNRPELHTPVENGNQGEGPPELIELNSDRLVSACTIAPWSLRPRAMAPAVAVPAGVARTSRVREPPAR